MSETKFPRDPGMILFFIATGADIAIDSTQYDTQEIIRFAEVAEINKRSITIRNIVDKTVDELERIIKKAPGRIVLEF